MSVQLSRPEGLLEQDDYAPLAVATGARTLYLAGQTATTPDGRVEDHDLAGQVHAALRYVVRGVEAGGGTVADIARLTCYLPDWSLEKEDGLLEGIARAQESVGLAKPTPPLTVIGVQALYRPEILVEIEAIAVVD